MNIWHIRLFGNLRVSRSDEAFSRFSTRKTGGLLAFLAFHAGRSYTRDVLCDLLWPDEPPQTSRARLRVALTSLRHQLEPPGTLSGSVLRSQGHDQVELVAGSVATDVAEVEQALRLLSSPGGHSLDARIEAGQRIVAFFTEPLLTGFYDDWVVTERERLNQAAVERLSTLAGHVPQDAAITFSQHASRLDPLSEVPFFALLPRLAEAGQHAAARHIFQMFRRRIQQELGALPTPQLESLVAALPESHETITVVPPAPKIITPRKTTPPPTFPRRLPPYPSRFFGRDAEREELRRALLETALVTLTGPGGTGKTRLAVETAGGWEGASIFVPLASVTDASLLPSALCDALGEKPKGAQDSPESLLARAADVLAASPTPLLILDNLEQLADSVGSLLLALTERVPNLRLLLTSRLRIHLPGEHELPLLPLPTPPPEVGEALEETARVSSVALFLDRARATRPDFQITGRNAEDVVTICRMLEGNPLAIELVAARAGTLVPSQMRGKLSERGNLRITNKRATPDDRHRSLYAAIDWSYQLLSPDLRRFFAHLSVFRGGFTAASAAAVNGDADETVAGEAVARLRAHSLVASVADVSEMRFSLLESLRTFGAEQLTDGEREAAAERHAARFAEVAEQFDAAVNSKDEAAWLERIDADLPNLRAAIEHDLSFNPLRALQVAGALATYWDVRGRPTEGRVWLEKAFAACSVLESLPDAPALRYQSRALHGAGILAMLQTNNAIAQPFFEESLRLRRASGDSLAVASTLNSLGLLFLSRQEWDRSRDFLSESLAIRRTIPGAELAGSLMNLGVVEWERGEYSAAKPLCEEALALQQERGDRIGEAQSLNNLGTIALSQGDFGEAAKWLEQSLAIKRIVGYPRGIAMTLSNLGVAAMYQGRHATATAYFEESLALYREMNVPDSIAAELRNLAETAIFRRDWEHAYSLLSESLSIIRGSDIPDDIAGTLEGFALLAAARGEAESAAHLLGTADTLRAESDCPLYPSERVALDKAADAARNRLGEEGFEKAVLAGKASTPETAIALALALAP